MRVFLFGFMGSGKTTVGKQLAKRMKLTFIDLDHYIETNNGKTIKYLFEAYGESHFREIEQNALSEVIRQNDFVLATGGGTPCFYDNIEVMNSKGVTVFLELDKQTLVHRLMNAKIHRPLIWGKTEEELREYIEVTLNQRNPYYQKAQIFADGKDIDLDKLTKKVARRAQKNAFGTME